MQKGMNTHWPWPGRIYNMKDEKGIKVVQKAMLGMEFL